MNNSREGKQASADFRLSESLRLFGRERAQPCLPRVFSGGDKAQVVLTLRSDAASQDYSTPGIHRSQTSKTGVYSLCDKPLTLPPRMLALQGELA